MAEHSEAETKELAEIFSQGYNKQHKTNYSWVDGKSYVGKNGIADDFVLFDGKKSLGVQLTRAVENQERDFIRHRNADRVIAMLLESLKEWGANHLYIHINFEHQPQEEEQARQLAYWLNFFIREKSKRGSRELNYYTYDASFDNQFLKRITSYVSDFRILPSPDRDGAVVGWSTSKEYPEPHLDDEQRVTAAVAKKAERYQDKSVTILVDAFKSPIFDFYIPLIEESVKDLKVGEVWIVENFIGNQRVIRVK